MKQTVLSRATLSELNNRVAVPTYDPAAITAGIVHLGLGGFGRSHMARYTHDLLNDTAQPRDWGIVGGWLLPADRRLHDALAPQDGLYTLVERNGIGEEATIIGAVTQMVFAGDDAAALLDAIDGPDIRIVSLTITENGYCLDPGTKRLDPGHPRVAADLTGPRSPHSAIGILVEAYRRRRDAGRRTFTALSCDNIQHNGDVLRAAVLDYAALLDPDLAAWIETAAGFPNTMVDRITPMTTAHDIAGLTERFGVIDRWPVFSESFSQWVIEDRFVDGRPAWERVGAQFVQDVAPYEAMKLRLLNASHLAIAGLGRLMNYEYVHEAIGDPRLRAYMTALMDRETGPTVPPVPGIDLARYKAVLVTRFANTAIRDTLERVNTDAPLNVLLDPVRDRLSSGEDIELLALAIAAWIRRVRGVDEQGRAIKVRHPLACELRGKAIQGGADPKPVMGIAGLFGPLGTDTTLVGWVGTWLEALYASGAAQTLERALAGAGPPARIP